MAKYSDADRERINADILKTFGSTVTRNQLLEYEEKTGVFAVWIYRGARIGRGMYHVPGGDGPAPAVIPPRTGARKSNGTRAKNVREVIPTPFDDDDYDREAAEFVPSGTVRVRELTPEQEERLYGKPDKDEMPRPVKCEALICTANFKHPKRSVGDRNADDTLPKCEVCGARMMSHYWTKPTPIDWEAFEAEHKPRRGRRKKIKTDDETTDETPKKKRGRPSKKNKKGKKS